MLEIFAYVCKKIHRYYELKLIYAKKLSRPQRKLMNQNMNKACEETSIYTYESIALSSALHFEIYTYDIYLYVTRLTSYYKTYITSTIKVFNIIKM